MSDGLSGFDWDSLPPGSLVVDVGGGTGAPAMILARSHIELRIIIQEREAVVDQGTEVCHCLGVMRAFLPDYFYF